MKSTQLDTRIGIWGPTPDCVDQVQQNVSIGIDTESELPGPLDPNVASGNPQSGPSNLTAMGTQSGAARPTNQSNPGEKLVHRVGIACREKSTAIRNYMCRQGALIGLVQGERVHPCLKIEACESPGFSPTKVESLPLGEAEVLQPASLQHPSENVFEACSKLIVPLGSHFRIPGSATRRVKDGGSR